MPEPTPEALFAQAAADQQNGRLQAAEAAYRALLGRFPGQLDVAHNLCRLLRADGRAREALALWEDIGRLHPSIPQPRLEQAGIHIEQGDRDSAEAALEAASRLATDAGSWRRIAAAQIRLHRYDLAFDAFQSALALGPAEAANFSGFASLCNELGEHAMAAESARAAIHLSPENGIGRLELGNALMHQGDYPGAADCFLQLLRLRPDSADAYCNLGLIHHEAMCLDAAVASFDAALAIDPGHEMARWNRSLALLTRGDLAAAWPDYELRRSSSIQKIRKLPACPEWQGEPLHGKTILLLHEQGLGDSLQFIRYAALLKDSGAKVWVRVPEALLGLFRGAAGVDAAFPDSLPYPEGADRFALLLSLPLRFATSLATIPGRIPYLQVAADAVEAWQQRLAGIPHPRVGVVWAGGKRAENAEAMRMDRRRSLSLPMLAPLLATPGAHFVGLQKGGAEAEIVSGNFCHLLADYAPLLVDLATTAALIANLDLVIGVDTAVVHLAGALGKPVWLLNRFDTDWRWLATGEASPWYPSLRQFRQTVPGDWDEPLRALSEALAAWVAAQAR